MLASDRDEMEASWFLIDELTEREGDMLGNVLLVVISCGLITWCLIEGFDAGASEVFVVGFSADWPTVAVVASNTSSLPSAIPDASSEVDVFFCGSRL